MLRISLALLHCINTTTDTTLDNTTKWPPSSLARSTTVSSASLPIVATLMLCFIGDGTAALVVEFRLYGIFGIRIGVLEASAATKDSTVEVPGALGTLSHYYLHLILSLSSRKHRRCLRNPMFDACYPTVANQDAWPCDTRSPPRTAHRQYIRPTCFNFHI